MQPYVTRSSYTADFPMVAPFRETSTHNAIHNTSNTKHYKTTSIKYDLRDRDKFVKWDEEMSRIVSSEFPVDFLQSATPEPPDAQDATDATVCAERTCGFKVHRVGSLCWIEFASGFSACERVPPHGGLTIYMLR